MSLASKRALRPRVSLLGASLLLTLLLAGCTSLGYYSHSIKGGLGILTRRRSIESLLADPTTSPELRERLELVLDIREFAGQHLTLPLGGSYRSYVDIDRPYAVWTVVAAEELSVEPVEWCFLIAGCVSYRGYFSREKAERFAEKLGRKGLETDVGGAAAFSTLGWFSDPVLSSFVDYPEAELAGLVFHELAHQRLYVKDDTTFNESFATVVELEGVRRWLLQDGRNDAPPAYRIAKQRQIEIADLVRRYRERLAAVYSREESEAWKRIRKEELFDELREAYRDLETSWGEPSRYGAWFGDGLNNARLASLGAYYDLVPAFETLLARAGGDLSLFYEQAAALGKLDKADRRARLQELSEPGVNSGS
ncbi:MAG: aminopeptidase [Acidobacteria bacterium]|nr:MAG: aminopeptidase [Acidobacteriota bacterium]